jgi:hypothetical protein
LSDPVILIVERLHERGVGGRGFQRSQRLYGGSPGRHVWFPQGFCQQLNDRVSSALRPADLAQRLHRRGLHRFGGIPQHLRQRRSGLIESPFSQIA